MINYMQSNWWMRFFFLLLVGTFSLAMVLPTIFDFDKDSSFPVKKKINLGLDLQGGLYMILGIDFNKVYADEISNHVKKIQYFLEDDGITAKLGDIEKKGSADPNAAILIANLNDVESAKNKVKENYAGYLRLVGENEGELKYALSNVFKQEIETQSVRRSIEVIRNRIDEFGVTEPEIFSQGKNRIVVQLPGVKNIERAKELIGKTAKLKFQIVNDEISPGTVQGWVEKARKAKIEYLPGMRFSQYLERLNQFLKKDLPEDHALAFQKMISRRTNKIEDMVPFVVEIKSDLDGDALKDARVQIDQQQNEPFVNLSFKSQGAQVFERITGDNVGRRMAIVLDGNVYSAPSINERIAGGNARITLGQGNFNKAMQEARDLALVLRAGALPVQLDFEEQRTVGPSLGRDSIVKARYASLVGAAIVLAFILFYYRISGAIAAITLSLNILLVLACLVAFEATLTLPGIAGIALTIGMAVDANIVIYERIRERVKKGLNFYKAVETGFAHAFWTIIDANITTALAGLCLLNFGTGPIRGFAVTLLIGIVATVYSSYFVGKLLFEFYMSAVKGQDLSI